eukprot:GSChrysophyteH1.ASY1.ANO1.1553.1 assembled CDS
MHNTFEFVAEDKAPTKFKDYMKSYRSSTPLNTAVITGKGKAGGSPLCVNYKGVDLSGSALKDQVEAWAPMGPYAKLLEHGACVICIDIPGKWGERPAAMWKRLIDIARKSSGSIIFPISGCTQKSCKDDDALIAAAGCNLMEAPAQILNWLCQQADETNGPIGLCTHYKGTQVAFLCTPTDIHVINDEAHKDAVANYGWHPGRVVEAFFNLVSFGKFLQKNACAPLKTNDPNKTLKIVDGLSVAQGPNYALAKRLQHWRAMIAYEEGHVVSSNIAPSTATLSVVSNRTFGWAYGGMPYFKPYEIFQQETTNGVMGALLIYDTTDNKSAANPKQRKRLTIDNTMELFKHNSVHGGVWRAAYTVDSIMTTSTSISTTNANFNITTMARYCRFRTNIYMTTIAPSTLT